MTTLKIGDAATRANVVAGMVLRNPVGTVYTITRVDADRVWYEWERDGTCRGDIPRAQFVEGHTIVALPEAPRGPRVGDVLTPENARVGMVVEAYGLRMTLKEIRYEGFIEAERGFYGWGCSPVILALPDEPALPTGRMAEVLSSDGERFAVGDKVRILSVAPAPVAWDGIPASTEPDRRPGHCVRHNVLACPRCDPFDGMTTAEIRAMVGKDGAP